MRAIYCAGEQGRVVLDILRASGDDSEVVFLDDDSSRKGGTINDVQVAGGIEVIKSSDVSIQCLVAFGDRRGVRLEIARNVADAGGEFFNAIHPNATVSENARIGDGITVNAQSYIGPGVFVDDHVLIDGCVNISHDVLLGLGSTITPNATLAGGVAVGRDAYVGPGATVIEDITIGTRAVVGAGAVVTEDVGEETTVVGVPAEPV